MIHHPIILMAYNRPGHLARVLDALRNQRPEPIFVFADGPKDNDDAQLVNEVRKVLREHINWTTPQIMCHAENLGLGPSIIYAVNTVLSDFDTMVLLEDDCVPSPQFLDFMYKCLNKYKQQDDIMSIGGWTMDIPDTVLAHYDYDVYFVTRIESWGWGTWKRAWQYYESDYAAAYSSINERGIDYARDGHSTVRNTEQAIRGYPSGVIPWSPGWMMATFLHNGYCVYPTRSLIENIGFDGSGASCAAGTDAHYTTSIATEWAPIRFPDRAFIDPSIQAVVKEFYR